MTFFSFFHHWLFKHGQIAPADDPCILTADTADVSCFEKTKKQMMEKENRNRD
jgi:hypothetical protein